MLKNSVKKIHLPILCLVPFTDERAFQELGSTERTKARLGCPERMEDSTGGQFHSRLLTGPEQYECLPEIDLGSMVAACQDSYIVSWDEMRCDTRKMVLGVSDQL